MLLTNQRTNIITNALSESEMTSSAIGHKLGVTTGQAVDLLSQMRERGEVESYVEAKTRILLWRLPATGDTISTVVERLNKQEAEISALKEALKLQDVEEVNE